VLVWRQAMETKEFLSAFSKLMKKYDCIKKSNNWYFTSTECITVLNLQHSLFGRFYYVNISSYIKAINRDKLYPKEYDCHLRTRLESQEEMYDGLSRYFNLENGIQDGERMATIEKMLETTIMDKIKAINTIDGMRDFINNENPLIGVQIAKEYLRKKDGRK
jgi:hypothetical protein